MSGAGDILPLNKGGPTRELDAGTVATTEVAMAILPHPATAETAPAKWSIPEWYKGIRFRSRLEVTYAKFLDAHRINWSYEPEGFELSGVRYLPDFHLPDIKTILEVKGILDEHDEAKLAALVPVAARLGILTILGIPGRPVRFKLCRPTPAMERIAQHDEGWAEVCSWDWHTASDISDDIAMVRCASCQSWYFIESSMSWQCTACDTYEGNGTFDLVHPGSEGWTCHDCPDCGVSGGMD